MKKIAIPSLLIFFILPLVYCSASTKIYFSPNGGCREAVIETISKAHETIDIAMYDFTSKPIAEELVKAKKRNVRVRIILDKSQGQQDYSKSKYLTQKGFGVKYHTGPGLMHNKFAIIDGQVLLTGSFNWTGMAEQKNEENLLVMTDQQVIREYQKRFEYLYRGSTKKEPSYYSTHHKKSYNSTNPNEERPVKFFRKHKYY